MIGSTEDDSDPIPRDQIEGTARQRHATIEGLRQQMSILEQKLTNCYEMQRKLIGAYQHLQGDLDELKRRRIAELNLKVNGGPTEHGVVD